MLSAVYINSSLLKSILCKIIPLFIFEASSAQLDIPTNATLFLYISSLSFYILSSKSACNTFKGL